MRYDIHLFQVPKSNALYQQIRERHYIPNKGSVGQQLHYLVYLERELIGIISGGSAAFATAPRDTFFGITKGNRITALNGIIDNTVFRLEKHLPNLGTQVLSAWRKQVVIDWQKKYNVTPCGFETFIIENERRKGAMYKADNWTLVGETNGSTKLHLHGVDKPSIRVTVDKKLIFCKWISGGKLPTYYRATWNSSNKHQNWMPLV